MHRVSVANGILPVPGKHRELDKVFQEGRLAGFWIVIKSSPSCYAFVIWFP